MSWEAFGSDDPFDIDSLYRHGWESDPDCVKWWKAGEPDDVFTLSEAIQSFEDWRMSED